MKLSDIMASMGLASYAEVGLVIFLLAFGAIAINLLFFRSRYEMDHAAQLPLADDDAATVHKQIDRSSSRWTT